MDESLRHFNPNPMLSANIFSKAFFCWLNPLFEKGKKEPLNKDDMFNVTTDDSSENLGAELEREWMKEIIKEADNRGKPSLLKALIRMFGFRYMVLGLIVFFEESVRVVQPLLLGGLIRYFTPNTNTTSTQAYLFALGVSLCAILIAITHHPYFFFVTRMGMQMRVACCSLMYKKALRLSNTALGETTTGQIVNLMSNDVNRFDQAVIFLHFLWIGPLQAIAVLIILWRELGPSVLAGFAVLLLLMPVQGTMGKLFSKLRRKTAVHTDERVKVMNEIIAGMRVIKMYCWERPFGDLVKKLRSNEVRQIQRARYMQALILAPNFFSIKLILLLTFLAYSLSGGGMTPEKVFVSIGIYQAIRVSITVFMPFAIQSISEMQVSCCRLQIQNLQDPFIELVTLMLQSELQYVRAKKRINAFTSSVWVVAHRLLTYTVVVTHVLTGSPLRAAPLYIGVSFMFLMAYNGIGCVFEGVSLFVESRVSARRIEASKVKEDNSYFITLIQPLWRKELGVKQAQLRASVFPLCVWFFGPQLINFALVVSLAGSGGVLPASDLYLALAFDYIVAANCLGFFFKAIRVIAEGNITLSRVQTFLLLDEIHRPALSQEQSPPRPNHDECFVEIQDLTAKWDKMHDTSTLEHVSASVKAGELLAVIGPVGSGKSSLLMAVLGELPALSGSINVKGKVAYVSQQAWIFSGSLRQNIIFGSKFDKTRFDKAVKASALHKDLEIMPSGDSTLIGDRGVSLSGGQRARVSLARALYMDADIYLLDDPLSAVDSVVGRHIFDRCILGELLKKPRILVTHQLQYLQAAKTILILNEGKAVGMGTYEELSSSGIDFAALLKVSEEEQEPEISVAPPDFKASNVLEAGSHLSLVSIGSDFEPEPVQLPEEEQRQEGTVGMKVYVEYFKAGAGVFKCVVLVLINLMAQGAYITSDWWLSRWSNDEEIRLAAIKLNEDYLSQGHNVTNVTIPYVDSHRNIYIFTGIIAGVFVFGMMRALLFFKIAVDASQTLHNNMFARILRTPISFFDTNPVGRVLNRFAKDVGHMDDLLPITFFDFVQCFLLILGIILVAGFVNPWVFIPTLPLVVLFLWIRRYYLFTSRSIKRLEGICRSPVFSYLSASLQGLHTIRAFGMEEKCQLEFDGYQDLHSEAWFLFLTVSRWLAVRLDWLCALFVTSVTFCSVLASSSLDAGLVGLSITYSMTLMGMFQWGVRQSAEVENQMISVERVLEYSQLPTEAPLETKKKPPDDWPNAGTIEANDLCLRYFPNSPDVLKNLTFRVREKEKIGIVGRTGAGKSSLITCLFRLVEPRGQLLVDGIDVCSLGLHDLRKNISIIPQDPVLFTGTLRKNLDPFFQHKDNQLWTALEEVQLKSAVEDLPAGLETQVSEGGVNFSVGQRQLICLARAILRHNCILLIDEATANVDPKTDGLIQETIRSKFRYCTVLTIAHRLHTVMDSDRVMVLSEGSIVQFEEPHLLLQRESGLFYNMVQQTGKADAEYLASIAAEAYYKRWGVPWPTREEKTDKTPSLHHLVDLKMPASAKPSKKLPIMNNIELDAPIAIAESFHSLLNRITTDDNDDDHMFEEKGSVDCASVADVSDPYSDETSSATPGPNSSSIVADSNTKSNLSTPVVSLVDELMRSYEFLKAESLTGLNSASANETLENCDIKTEGESDKVGVGLLPQEESGIGTDVNGGNVDTEDSCSSRGNGPGDKLLPITSPAGDMPIRLPASKNSLTDLSGTDESHTEFCDERKKVNHALNDGSIRAGDETEDEDVTSELEPLFVPGLLDSNPSSVRS